MILRGMVQFTRKMVRLPLPVVLWVGGLAVVNGFLPFLFWERPEARLVFLLMLVSATLMFTLTGLVGFVRLLGLGHFPWFALYFLLLPGLDGVVPTDAFGWWVRAVLFLNGVSLVLDVIDVGRYVRGERGEMVSAEGRTPRSVPRA